jgi:hypothetical protein
MQVLAQQLEKATGKTDDLLATAVGYVRQYADSASPESVSEVLSIIERKYGIKPIDVLSDQRPADAEPFISEVYPTTGWLGEYLQYTLGHEAPDIFHFWVGVSVLQSVIRRNIYFEHGYYRIYPNAYIILVAPPGKCRKSTAMDIGVGILTATEDVNVIREKVTPEALVKSLSTAPATNTQGGSIILETTSAALLYASELTVFLGREKYNEGLIALLTTLFDCHTRWESNTIGRGKTVLTNVHLGLLGGITPELIASSIPEIAMGGGFVSRTIFIVKERTPRCFSEPKPRDPLLREKLIAGLQRLSGIRTGIVQTAEARQWMEDWYKQQYMRQDTEMSLSGYYERKQTHLIKLAMTLLISDGVEDALVTPELYEKALRILETAERTMPLALEKVHNSEIGRFHDLVLDIIKKGQGSVTHSQLLRKVYGRMDADRLKKIVLTLTEAGMVSVGVSTGKGKNTTTYTMTRRDVR